MRALFASTAGSGHFSPLVPWIEHLCGLGHEVLVVGPPSLGRAAARWEFRAGGTADSSEVAAIMGRAMSMRHQDVAEMVIGEVFTRLNAGALVPSMRAAIGEFRPDVVLRDPAEFASALCAAEAGIAQVRVGHGLATGEETLLRYAGPILEQWREGLTEVVAGSAYFTRFPESVDPAAFPVTRRYREGAAPRTVPSREGDFVYVTLGTVAPTIPVLLPWYQVLLEALEGLPIRALMTVGRDLEPRSLGPVPPNVEVSQWADQSEAMARAAAVVHHGGSGTVLGALEWACPQLVVPLFADQGDNAVMVERKGLGLAVAERATAGAAAMRGPGSDDAHRIHEKLQHLLAADGIRARSREVADHISRLPTLANLSFG